MRNTPFPGRLTTALPKPPASSPGLRVLVVENDADTALSLALILLHHGHQVCVALDGPSALQATEVNPFDVVLLDLVMPGMDGYEVARRLQSLPTADDMLIVVVSGRVAVHDRLRSLEAGIDFHLAKPVAPEELLNLLQAHRDRRKLPGVLPEEKAPVPHSESWPSRGRVEIKSRSIRPGC